MMNKLLAACVAAIPLVGCATDQHLPLVFARTQTAGIGIQGSAADQGASLTLGFNDRNIAVVPTTGPNGEPIRSGATGDENRPFSDALSVLGQFSMGGNARNVEANLGTFFSTGLAARNLAEGFRDEMRGFGQPAREGAVIPHPDSAQPVAPPQ